MLASSLRFVAPLTTLVVLGCSALPEKKDQPKIRTQALERWLGAQLPQTRDALDHGRAVAALNSAGISSVHSARLVELLAEARERRDEEDILTKTQAAVVFTPKLRVAQAALVQSFSLRNLFQMLNPASDPEDVREAWTSAIALDPVLHRPVGVRLPDGSLRSRTDYDTTFFTAEERELLVEYLVDEQLNDRTWLSRTDILSLDIGITAPAISIGDNGEEFDERVDKGFPQFLLGLGLSYRGFQASGGVMLYRDSAGDFEQAGYGAVSIELFSTYLGLKRALEDKK